MELIEGLSEADLKAQLDRVEEKGDDVVAKVDSRELRALGEQHKPDKKLVAFRARHKHQLELIKEETKKPLRLATKFLQDMQEKCCLFPIMN